jgi:hypothetical protein
LWADSPQVGLSLVALEATYLVEGTKRKRRPIGYGNTIFIQK